MPPRHNRKLADPLDAESVSGMPSLNVYPLVFSRSFPSTLSSVFCIYTWSGNDWLVYCTPPIRAFSWLGPLIQASRTSNHQEGGEGALYISPRKPVLRLVASGVRNCFSRPWFHMRLRMLRVVTNYLNFSLDAVCELPGPAN